LRGTKGRIGLAGGLPHRTQIGFEVGQSGFQGFASALRNGIDTDNPAVQFVQPFAEGSAVPTQLDLGLPGSTPPQSFDHGRHEHPPRRAAQLRQGLLPDRS